MGQSFDRKIAMSDEHFRAFDTDFRIFVLTLYV